MSCIPFLAIYYLFDYNFELLMFRSMPDTREANFVYLKGRERYAAKEV